MGVKRNRFIYGILVVLLGLGTRRFSYIFPSFLGKYGGDTFWALMVFLGIGFLWSDLICYAVGIGIGFCGEYFFYKKRILSLKKL